jgi:hypothetical protein
VYYKTIKNMNTERPIPITEIYSGDKKLMSRTALYNLKEKGVIKFYYLGNKPFVYMSEINAAMTLKENI